MTHTLTPPADSDYLPTLDGHIIKVCNNPDHRSRYWLTGDDSYPAHMRWWLCADCHLPLTDVEVVEVEHA